jgi:hypothetical protein
MSDTTTSIQMFLKLYAEIVSDIAVILNIVLIVSIFRVNIFPTHLRLLLANIVGKKCSFSIQLINI